jgi:hypothetical protein
MRVTLLASALAFATLGSMSALAETFESERLAPTQIVPVLTDAQIARFRSALTMTPAQERLWAPVEAELRNVMRQARGPMKAGFINQVRSRIATITLDAVAIKRIAVAAAPLIAALEEEQRREGLRAAGEIGIGHLLAAF